MILQVKEPTFKHTSGFELHRYHIMRWNDSNFVTSTEAFRQYASGVDGIYSEVIQLNQSECVYPKGIHEYLDLL